MRQCLPQGEPLRQEVASLFPFAGDAGLERGELDGGSNTLTTWRLKTLGTTYSELRSRGAMQAAMSAAAACFILSVISFIDSFTLPRALGRPPFGRSGSSVRRRVYPVGA